MTEAERQARFRSRLRALAEEPERLASGNYRDACADCGQVMIARSIAELDGACCACPPTCVVWLHQHRPRFNYIVALTWALRFMQLAGGGGALRRELRVA
jgi:hypothetical protein